MIYNTECNTRAEHQEQSQVEQRSRENPERVVLKPPEPQHWPFLLWKFKGYSHMLLLWMAVQLPVCCLPLSWRLSVFVKQCSEERLLGFFRHYMDELQSKVQQTMLLSWRVLDENQLICDFELIHRTQSHSFSCLSQSLGAKQAQIQWHVFLCNENILALMLACSVWAQAHVTDL